MAVEIIGVIFGGLSCICGTATYTGIERYRNFNDDVKKLKRKLEDLTLKKGEIESRIQTAAAYRWLKEEPTISGPAQEYYKKVQGVEWYKRACFFLDPRLRKKIEEVEEMIQRGEKLLGSYTAPTPPERASAPPDRASAPPKNLVEEIWGYLMGDEVGMIGVCGIGVRKTEIMKSLHDDLQTVTRFKKVIWVTVSHSLRILELQEKIADAMGKRLPDNGNVKKRAVALMKIMETMTYVVILDDVWEKFTLKEVGIPEPNVQNGCKVVVTSRSIDSCNYLHCKIVEVPPRLEEDPLNLDWFLEGDIVFSKLGLCGFLICFILLLRPYLILSLIWRIYQLCNYCIVRIVRS
ncbi:hypothetical protein SLA2020_250360 [Shorea laevis]